MQTRGDTQAKTLVLGLDGATFDVILPLIEQGLLPNLTRLMRDGCWGPLESTVHPITPRAWSSFMTGMNAGKHGVLDFTERDPLSYGLRYVNGSFRKAGSLWSYLSDAGVRVGVMNVPFTYPPEPVNGFLISGFDARGLNSGFTYPADLLREIIEGVGRYELRGGFPIGKRKGQYGLDDIARVIDNHTQVARFLLTHHAVDFFMVVFTSTDHVQHLFWRHWEDKRSGIQGGATDRYGDIIPQTYRKADDALCKLIEYVGSDALVIVLSDHGGGRLDAVVYLNRWLERQGWLVYKKPAGGRLNGMVRNLEYGAKRYLPQSCRDWIKTVLPGVRDATASYLFASNIDWTRTKAYTAGMYGNIYLNVKGREGQGVVEPGAEFESVRDRIIRDLEALEGPNGCGPVVGRAYRREELFSGQYVWKAPDILVEWKDYACFAKGTLMGEKDRVFGEKLFIDSSDFEHTGTHRRDGVFIVKGPGIRSKGRLEGLRIVDVAPTVLYSFGCEVPRDMDGRVLTDLFEEEFVKQHPIRKGMDSGEGGNGSEAYVYSDKEREEVEERLKALGYL